MFDATTGMLQLPESFLDVSALLGNRCAMRTASNSSSFLISANRDESTPDDLLTTHASKFDDARFLASLNSSHKCRSK